MNRTLTVLLTTSLALLVIVSAGLLSLGVSGRNPPTGAAAMASLAQPSLRIDACTEVGVGDTFSVDIWGLNVTNLLAWEINFVYDRDIIEVVGRDVRVFLASQQGSNVFDLSDPVPNTSGLYRIAAADLGSKDATENGSGILARVTLGAKQTGVSAASISQIDFDGDGSGDLGPTLTSIDDDGEVTFLGDSNGDGLMEEENISSGQIAVGRPCSTQVPTPPIEDIVGTLPIVATPSGSPRPDESPAGEPSPSQGTPSSETPGPGPVSGATAEATPVADATPEVGPGLGTDDGDSGDGDSGNDGLPTWLIVLIVAAVALGLILSFAVIRSARRPA